MGNKVINTTSVKLGIYETSTDEQLEGMLGDVKEMEDGRKFRLCRNGTGGALVPGKAVQGTEDVGSAKDEDLAIGTASAGATTLTVTVNAAYGADLVANYFRGGWFCVGAGSEELGHGRKIKANTAAAQGSDTTLTFYDALTDVITADSTGAWCRSQFIDVVVDAGTARAVGVPVCDVTLSVADTTYYYFWAQVSGACPMVSGGAIVAGDNVMVASGCAIATTGTTPETIGTAMQAFDSADVGWIFLNLE